MGNKYYKAMEIIADTLREAGFPSRAETWDYDEFGSPQHGYRYVPLAERLAKLCKAFADERSEIKEQMRINAAAAASPASESSSADDATDTDPRPSEASPTNEKAK